MFWKFEITGFSKLINLLLFRNPMHSPQIFWNWFSKKFEIFASSKKKSTFPKILELPTPQLLAHREEKIAACYSNPFKGSSHWNPILTGIFLFSLEKTSEKESEMSVFSNYTKEDWEFLTHEAHKLHGATIPLRFMRSNVSYSNNTLIRSNFMDAINYLTILTHLFSYSFNFLMLYLVSNNKSGIKTKSYITHMIWVELVLNICQHCSVESVLRISDQKSMRLLTAVCIFFMSLQMWTVNTIRYILTFVMAVHRFASNVNPRLGKYFDADSITFLGCSVWLFAFIASWYLLLLGCFPRFNTETFVLDTNCYYLKWPDFIYKSHYLLILTLALNIAIVVHAKLRRSGFFKVAIARISVAAANRRNRKEAMFVIQSLIVSLFMAYDALYTSLRKSYESEFQQLPQNVQILMGWLNIYSANYINFLVYFMFHKNNRFLVLRTVFCNPQWLKNHKIRPT